MKREVVDALIASLNDPNAGWEYSKYMATNNRIKCEIWLANGVEFLEVKFWGGKIGPSKGGWETRVSYGGDWWLLANFIPWRWRVYLAASKHQAAALREPEVPDSTIIAAIRSASEVPA